MTDLLTPKTLRITLEVIVTTDREGWEYGDHLARFLAGEINADAEEIGLSNRTRAAASCLDVERAHD